jgi:nucleotide-binding universal stress UspA family protein
VERAGDVSVRGAGWEAERERQQRHRDREHCVAEEHDAVEVPPRLDLRAAAPLSEPADEATRRLYGDPAVTDRHSANGEGSCWAAYLLMSEASSMVPLGRFDSLIVALDFGPLADRMVPIVGRLASRAQLSIRMVTTGSPGLEQYDVADLAERTGLIHGCPVTSVVIDGDNPADELADYVGSQPGALLCLASHGRTAIGEVLLGSMTEDLLRRHVGAMLAIGPDVPDDYELADKLVVCIDERSLHTSLLEVSVAWQTTFGGTVELFEAIAGGSAQVPIEPTAELRAAHELVPAAVMTVVESHDPVRAIGDAAMASRSVIAVAGHARSGLERAFRGSVTGELLHFSTVPLLIVPT